jgi:hypothetical protein
LPLIFLYTSKQHRLRHKDKQLSVERYRNVEIQTGRDKYGGLKRQRYRFKDADTRIHTQRPRCREVKSRVKIQNQRNRCRDTDNRNMGKRTEEKRHRHRHTNAATKIKGNRCWGKYL